MVLVRCRSAVTHDVKWRKELITAIPGRENDRLWFGLFLGLGGVVREPLHDGLRELFHTVRSVNMREQQSSVSLPRGFIRW